jgi:hypothetical protein
MQPPCESQEGPVTRAFAVVIVGLCIKFNMKWIFISILKIKYGPKLHISPNHLSVFEERRLFYMLANFFGE